MHSCLRMAPGLGLDRPCSLYQGRTEEVSGLGEGVLVFGAQRSWL